MSSPGSDNDGSRRTREGGRDRAEDVAGGQAQLPVSCPSELGPDQIQPASQTKRRSSLELRRNPRSHTQPEPREPGLSHNALRVRPTQPRRQKFSDVTWCSERMRKPERTVPSQPRSNQGASSRHKAERRAQVGHQPDFPPSSVPRLESAGSSSELRARTRDEPAEKREQV